MSNFAPKRTSYDYGDRRCFRDLLKSEAHGVTLTYAEVSALLDSDGVLKIGKLIAGQGLVKDGEVFKAGEKHLISVVHAGTVDRRYLPTALTYDQEQSLSAVAFINGTAPTPPAESSSSS